MNPNRKPDDGPDVNQPDDEVIPVDGDTSKATRPEDFQDEYDDPSGEMLGEPEEIRNAPPPRRGHVATP